MELGGVSVPGTSPRSGGAYLAKDLSVFAAELGGLEAFLMVSDGTADDDSGAAAQLVAQAADAHLEAVLLDVATGKTPVIAPALILEAIVAEANSAIMSAAKEPGASNRGATFFGALISADRVWFGSIGGGSGYILRKDEARELLAPRAAAIAMVPEVAPIEAQAPDAEPAEVVEPEAGPALGREGISIEVASVDLSPGDSIVVCGPTAASALHAPDILGISCAACNAGVAATELADKVSKTGPEGSVTVALWSADSALFTPVPVPAVQAAAPDSYPAAPFFAANDGGSTGLRAERAFLWVMSGWIVVAFLVLGVGALMIKPSNSASSDASTSAQAAAAAQEAANAAAAQAASAAATPTVTAQTEFPKALTVPKNVKGGVWLRKNPNTLGGSNEVATLKAGAKVQAVNVAEGTDDTGKTQEFYVLNVADISKSQIVKASGHPWPPAKSVKTVYVFSGSFK
jgi:hypothetical protein